MIALTCEKCGRDFLVYPSQLKAKENGKFCSRTCRMADTRDRRKAPLTATRLRSLLGYDPETGVFRWKESPRHCSGRIAPGDIAGTVDHKGYRDIMIDDRGYRAHRLAWLYVHGEWPQGLLDHKDRNRDHNAIANLRPATNGQNRANSAPNSGTKFGMKGVSQFGKRYAAYIKALGKVRYIGMYDTPEEAHAAYAEAAKRLHGEFARVA